MNSTPQQSLDDREIDLSQISKRFGNAFDNFSNWIFRGFLFIKRNLIILAILFIIGAGTGFYLDKQLKIYDHEIIVVPNFKSADYVYSKVNLIKAKIMENDKAFLKSIGLNPEQITDIEIKPISDIYNFVSINTSNFELVKLMAENSDIDKVVNNQVTSLNFTNHRIKLTTKGKVERNQLVEPLLKYLDENEYFTQVQKSILKSIDFTIKTNDKTLNQIDSLLASFSSASSGSQKNDKLVYYNENTQLNDILKTKAELVEQQAYKRIELITGSKLVKESSAVLNIKNTEGLNGKLKFILPFLLIGLFIFLGAIKSFYKNQMLKLQNQAK
ncbi:MAG TPA: hypothetical protein VFR70_00610 [Flavobacterium sp.]|nr:hypothetical protein [Flavobacterium sp.]